MLANIGDAALEVWLAGIAGAAYGSAAGAVPSSDDHALAHALALPAISSARDIDVSCADFSRRKATSGNSRMHVRVLHRVQRVRGAAWLAYAAGGHASPVVHARPTVDASCSKVRRSMSLVPVNSLRLPRRAQASTTRCASFHNAP